LEPLVFGFPTDKEGLQLRLGIEQGFFRAEGIDLSIEVIFGGPEIAARYSDGRLKIGELGSPPATTALARGARFTIVASSVRRKAVQYVVAAPSVRGWDDLRGRKVAALSIGSCSYWFFRQVLESKGLDPDRDVELVGLGARYPEVVALFASGELAAAVISEPNVSIGEAAGAFSVRQALTDEAFCPGMQWGVVVANDAFLAERPDLVRAVLRGCRASYRYCDAHPDQWIAFGARHFGIATETMARSIERERAGLHADGEIELESLQQAIDLQRRLGAFQVPLRAADIVDLTHLPGRP
jgi:NitT/TauT family transport system substrate-binding protein